MRLNSFDYFRGIAILFVVTGHSFGTWGINSVIEKTIANLIGGGTILFVFISGFFFHYAFYKKIKYKEFMVKKLKNIFIPYLVLSILGIIYYIVSSSPFLYTEKTLLNNDAPWVESAKTILDCLLTGKTFNAYWYMPFIFIIFALSPLFNQYIRLSRTIRITILLLLLPISMIVHRSPSNVSPLQSVIYFAPVYMLGICCSIDREKLIKYLQDKTLILGLATISLAMIQAIFYKNTGSFFKEDMLAYGGVDIMMPQKILMCFFFVSLLQKYENKNIPILKHLATTSFAIYFIHPWLILLIRDTKLLSRLKPIPGLITFVITAFVVLICSMLIAFLFKRIFKKNSQYIIGW